MTQPVHDPRAVRPRAMSLPHVGEVVFSLFYWLWFVFIAPIMFSIHVVVFILTAAFDRNRHANHAVNTPWGHLCLLPQRMLGIWHVEFVGRDRVNRTASTVYVANHCSQMDIVLGCAAGMRYKWVSKQSVFWVPFVGWSMFLAKYIPLRRGDARSILAMMRVAEARLAEGSSVLIYPEGTRSPDGRLQSFKNGAFTLAKRAGVQVVPVAVSGSSKCLQKGSMRVGSGVVAKVEFLSPIPAEIVSSTDAGTLATMARERIAERLPPEQQPPVESASRGDA